MKPTISIIVPVYNIELHIGKCLDSIIKQTFTDFEVIVVNDGSTDESGVICDEYASNDERVKVLHQEYGGVSSARNAGIDTAQGDYIGFVDGDDYIDENMYKKLYQSCIETESDISICELGREINGRIVNPDVGEFYTKELKHQEAMSELFKGVLYRFSLCNKLFKRTCFKNVNFPEGRIHEDLSTTYKLFANANKAIFINYVGYIYVKQQNSILTSSYNEKRLDAFIGWDEILSYMRKHYDQLLGEVYACYGYWCVDNVYYILNQIIDSEERNNYLIKIQKNVNKYYKNLMKNKLLSFKCKYIVSMINFNVRLLVFSNRIKKVLD